MDGRLGEKTANGRAKWWDEMWSFKPASRGGGQNLRSSIDERRQAPQVVLLMLSRMNSDETQ
jgi:hypothetical protein